MASTALLRLISKRKRIAVVSFMLLLGNGQSLFAQYGEKRQEPILSTPSDLGRELLTTEPVDASVLELSSWIDEQVLAGLRGANLEPESLSDEESFLRRAYLDLAGVNPEPRFVVDYVSQSGPTKRHQMLKSLIASPMVSIRLADQWTDLLLPEDANVQQVGVQRESLRRWLHRKFADGVRYDRIVAELLISSGDPQEQPTAFFTALEVNPEKLAEKTCRVFLGVALDCAQCHDHPFDSWKQTDFWGVAAYFAQVNAQTPMNNAGMALPGIRDLDQGEVFLPETQTVVYPKPLVSGIDSSLATGSRRQQLAIWLTSKQNPWFAKAAVNRVWSMMMGRGLIEPVDDMGKNSIPSHPEILDRLSEYFRKSGYDLKKLFLVIACTETYARSSYSSDGLQDQSRFQAMIAKPLTARQLANSLRQAARQPSGEDSDVWSLFASGFGKIRGESSDYSGGVLQSLSMQHSATTQSLWSEVSSKLLSAIQAPHLSRQERLEWMYLATLARRPSDEERASLEKIFSEIHAPSEIAEAEADLLWALINSTEFAMTP